MSGPPDRELWSVCVHEAGHAIVALRHGCRIDHATVRPDGTGVVVLDGPAPPGLAGAELYFSGYCAEASFAGRLFVPDADLGALGSDSEHLARLRRRHGAQAIRDAMLRTFSFLHGRPAEIEAIAAALYRRVFTNRPRLSGTDIIRLTGGRS